MNHRRNWRRVILAMLLATAACGRNPASVSAEAPSQKAVAAGDITGPEKESLPASVADRTFKSYYAWRYYAPNGTFENGDGYTIKTGRWWMKDGEVCAQFDSGGAKPLCSKPDYSMMRSGRRPG
jgi:hypothetical protein